MHAARGATGLSPLQRCDWTDWVLRCSIIMTFVVCRLPWPTPRYLSFCGQSIGIAVCHMICRVRVSSHIAAGLFIAEANLIAFIKNNTLFVYIDIRHSKRVAPTKNRRDRPGTLDRLITMKHLWEVDFGLSESIIFFYPGPDDLWRRHFKGSRSEKRNVAS